MRIVHIITRMILGGAQENTVLTCEGLARRGHEVTLITGPALGLEGELMTRARSGGYRVIELDDLRREIHPVHDWRAYRDLRRCLSELQPDVVHTHSSKAGILARRAARQAGAPIVVHTIHGLPFHPYQPWWLRRLYIALERRAANQCQAIVSVADAMTTQALAAGVGRPEQFTTIYSGMEVGPYLNRPAEADGFRASLNLPAGAVLVTQISRLAELKGHEYIIQAAAVLPENIIFCFVGDGAWRAKVQGWIAEAGLADRFRLTGLLPPSEIPAVCHATDILVHCSLREGLARAIPQAMLAGKPVISYDVDGASEVVLPDRTGILLPPREVEGLGRAIHALADDPALRLRLGQAGRDLARERFSAETMVDQIDALYRRLIRL